MNTTKNLGFIHMFNPLRHFWHSGLQLKTTKNNNMGISKTTEILYIMFPLKSLLSAIKIIFISDML